jgi:hypothetical protein
LSFALSRAAAEWLNITEPVPTTTITLEDINKFRSGPYADATVDTKKKWCHVMLHFLPGVCSKYGKSDIRLAVAASLVSTTSDEALVMWLLRFNANDWETENEKNNETPDTTQNDDNEAPLTRKRKRKGPHMSQMNLQEFLDMLNATTAKRGEGGSGWDDALMTAEQEERERASGTKGNSFDDAIVGTGKDTVVQSVVMPYNLSTGTEV